MAETLDSALTERLRAVAAHKPVTEGELRSLSEEGRERELILGGELERCEQRLEVLASDPTSSLAEIADALRAVNVVRPDLDELRALLADLDGRARESRAGWLSAPAR